MFFYLQLVGIHANKAWSKDAVNGLYLREIRKAKKLIDDRRRVAEATAHAIGETGGGPGRQFIQQTPADDLEPPRVDPRLLTGCDPTRDHMSVVNVPAGSCFANSQDQAGIISRVAPPRQRGAAPAATATSGAYEAQLAAAAAHPISAGQAAGSAEVLQTLMVEVADEDMGWAQDILNTNRDVSMQSSPALSPLR